jgi:Zn-dependent peptidase ImmA (M78 family)
MSDILSYKSKFEPSVNVFILFKENEMYDEIKPLFDMYGYGFASAADNLVFIDGEEVTSGEQVDEDALRFIEAHEVSHILLGHTNERNDDDEMDADLGAYVLLKKYNFPESIEILEDNFESRHGVKFKKSLIQRVSDKIF